MQTTLMCSLHVFRGTLQYGDNIELHVGQVDHNYTLSLLFQ